MNESTLEILIHLCSYNEIKLLSKFIYENPELINSKIHVPSGLFKKYSNPCFLDDWMLIDSDFDNVVDFLCYYSVINNKFEVVDALLELNSEKEYFFDYKTLGRTFFMLIIKEDTNRLDKLIKNGFDYSNQHSKTLKGKPITHIDLVLGACINRSKERSIEYILNLREFYPEDFWVSMISISAYSRVDILKKIFRNDEDIRRYTKELKFKNDEINENLINMLEDLTLGCSTL